MKDMVFISYRREDSSTFASILYTELTKHFLPENIFKDYNNLTAGVDFKKEIDTAIDNASVVLVLISKLWLQKKARSKFNRLFDEDDFVRHEIRCAIEKNLTIIPVLFENAVIPKKEDLPELLWPLCDKQAFTIHAENVFNDIASLIDLIRAKRKFLFDEYTILGAGERLLKNPMGNLKEGLTKGLEIYKKDFTALRDVLKKKK